MAAIPTPTPILTLSGATRTSTRTSAAAGAVADLFLALASRCPSAAADRLMAEMTRVAAIAVVRRADDGKVCRRREYFQQGDGQMVDVMRAVAKMAVAPTADARMGRHPDRDAVPASDPTSPASRVCT
jgi:hypothetical protein